MYTFKMTCEEEPGLSLEDEAIRIFLNTKGKNPEAVSPELVELLHYMENTNEETSRQCKSVRIRQMQERVKGIKSSEEVGVRYMQEWEERELDRREAREEGRIKTLISLICKKMLKGKDVDTIADELEEELPVVEKIYEAAAACAPEYDIDKIYTKLSGCDSE